MREMRRIWMGMNALVAKTYQWKNISVKEHISATHISAAFVDAAVSHIWTSHVTHINESCHTYEWVLSRIWMIGFTHVNTSWRIWGGDVKMDMSLRLEVYICLHLHVVTLICLVSFAYMSSVLCLCLLICLVSFVLGQQPPSSSIAFSLSRSLFIHLHT